MAMNYGPQQGAPYPVQAQAPMPPQKKKGMSTGCIIAIVVVLVFFGSVGAVVAFIGYKISTDKDVQNVMGALGDAANLAAEAQSAPGTAELRGIGCEQAMALDMAKMEKMLRSFVDAGPGASPTGTHAGMDVGKMVVCQASAFGTAPTCDDAAKAYIKGASPTKNFLLSVQQNKRDACSNLYAPNGTIVAPGGKP